MKNTKENQPLNTHALIAILENLFEHCVMIHKYGGDACNQREADAAQSAALEAIATARSRDARHPAVILSVSGGVIQGARGTERISVEVFDEDDEEQLRERFDIPHGESISSLWENTISREYPEPLL
jgi:hypothetical protein